MCDSKEPSIISCVKICEVHKKRDTNETASLGLIVAFVEVVAMVHFTLVAVIHCCPVLSFFRKSSPLFLPFTSRSPFMAVFLRTESCCGLLSNSANSEYAATSTCVDVQKTLFL